MIGMDILNPTQAGGFLWLGIVLFCLVVYIGAQIEKKRSIKAETKRRNPNLDFRIIKELKFWEYSSLIMMIVSLIVSLSSLIWMAFSHWWTLLGIGAFFLIFVSCLLWIIPANKAHDTLVKAGIYENS